jgi:hypothetical protein
MTSVYGSKFGFLTRSRLYVKTLLAEFKQLLNQFHGSNAQKRNRGYAAIFSGITFWKIRIRTSNCATGNNSDQITPKNERLY